MLTIIKKTNYTNPIKTYEKKYYGFDISSEKVFDEKLRIFKTEMKSTPAQEDYFPDTKWRESELSYIIPAGIEPGQISMLKPSPLEIGDFASKAADIIEQSDLNEIIEQ